MTPDTDRPAGEEAALREQLASFRPLLALSMMMTNSRDEHEILRIATTAVTSMGGCHTEAVYLDGDWPTVGRVGQPPNADFLRDQLAALNGAQGVVDVGNTGWTWAFPLADRADMDGYLVVTRDTEPEDHHRFMLNVLVQQTGVALVNARLHARERVSTARAEESAERERAIADELRAANLALEHAMEQLARTSAAMQRSLDVHNRFTAAASAGEGQEGIARALHELAGLPVAIEDRHGNLAVWAGPGQPDPYPKPTPARREQVLRRVLDANAPVRDKGRLITLAQSGGHMLGTIALIDPDKTAGDTETVALEHACTVLTLELAHLQAMGEVELRLRRDLVEELLAGTDAQSAHDRARALGYDLARRHRVVIITNGQRRGDPDAFFHAVRRAVRTTGAGSLLASRPGGVAVLCDTDQNWEQFRQTIIVQLSASGRCRIGVGAPCTDPQEFPRSHGQAQLALKMQVATKCPEQVTAFEDLGIYQLLSEIATLGSVEAFIHHWLGPLLDYDASKNAQLVDTLSSYLECGGNYDLTAKTLSLHRSTLRYRLQRIREISGRELNDPDTRFNLQLATRAWTTVYAMRQTPTPPRG